MTPNLQLKAKFHYAILVADRSEAGRRPVADLLARASSMLVIGQISARCRSATSLGPVCDQDSVMEFGFQRHYVGCILAGCTGLIRHCKYASK